MRVTITPFAEPEREIDVTQRLVSAIAEEIWRACGGNDSLNWLEAERHLARIVGDAGTAARASQVADARDMRASSGCTRPQVRGGGRAVAPLGSRRLVAARAPDRAMAEW